MALGALDKDKMVLGTRAHVWVENVQNQFVRYTSIDVMVHPCFPFHDSTYLMASLFQVMRRSSAVNDTR